MTAAITSTDDLAVIEDSHVEAAAKAIALHDGWTELDWDTVNDRYKRRYYRFARVALDAADQILLARVQKQQTLLEAVDRLSQDFVMKPVGSAGSIEQPGFGRGVRAAGRELRTVLDATEAP